MHPQKKITLVTKYPGQQFALLDITKVLKSMPSCHVYFHLQGV